MKPQNSNHWMIWHSSNHYFSGILLNALNAGVELYVAIHARLGYGLGELRKDASRFDLSRTVTSLRGTARFFAHGAADLAVSQLRGGRAKKAQFFLATDTPEFRPLLALELGDRLPSARLTFVDGETVRHVRELTVIEDDDVRLFMDMFVVVFLLSWSDAMINLRSGFSDLGVWMGGV